MTPSSHPILQTVLQYGWIPFIIYVGYTRSNPQPSLIKCVIFSCPYPLWLIRIVNPGSLAPSHEELIHILAFVFISTNPTRTHVPVYEHLIHAFTQRNRSLRPLRCTASPIVSLSFIGMYFCPHIFSILFMIQISWLYRRVPDWRLLVSSRAFTAVPKQFRL